MKDIGSEAKHARSSAELRRNRDIAQYYRIRLRLFLTMAFAGAVIYAFFALIFEHIITTYYTTEYYVIQLKSAGQFLGFVLIIYGLIQVYLESGTSQPNEIRIGEIRYSAPSSANADAVASGNGTVPEIARMLDGLSPGGPTVPPSFDDPSRLAGLLVRRLEEEIGAQSRRANANLGLGIVAAITGLLFLGWLSMLTADELFKGVTQPTNSISGMLYWGSFAAKISLSLAANVFAFFFFTSYRRNLSEVRYFHNELTNIQARFVAVGLTNPEGPADLRKAAIKSLIELERNFVLQKGETTAELAMRQYDKDDLVTLTSLILKAGQINQVEDAKPAPVRRKRAAIGK